MTPQEAANELSDEYAAVAMDKNGCWFAHSDKNVTCDYKEWKSFANTSIPFKIDDPDDWQQSWTEKECAPVATHVQATCTPVTKYEYLKEVNLSHTQLNTFGRDGWEVVAFSIDPDCVWYYVLKRGC